LSNFDFVTGVVDVDRGEAQPSFLRHLVEPMHAGGRLLGDADDLAGHRRVPVLPGGEPLLDGGEERPLFLAGRVREHGRIRLGPDAQVREERRVAAVVEDHVRTRPVELEDLVGEIPVLVE
jgi:hypothetical protein